MIIKIYTDGGSLGNPGPAAYAFAIYYNGELLSSTSQPIGVATNNVAEYTALIKALEKTKNLIASLQPPIAKIVVYSDSQLLINQVNGLFKVKNALLREFVLKIRGLEQELSAPITYQQIPREQNSFADSLIKKTLGI